MSRQEDDLLKRQALLFAKRHIITHRGAVKIGVKEETVERDFAMNVSTSGVESRLLDLARWVSFPPPPVAPGARPTVDEPQRYYLRKVELARAHIYFKDSPDQGSIVSICGSAYEDMARLVAEAENGSWKAGSV